MSSPASDLQYEFISCPLCGKDDAKKIATFDDWIYQIGGPFEAVRCGRCGHRYLNPRPVEADLLKCYPTHYGPHHVTTQSALSSSSLSDSKGTTGGYSSPPHDLPTLGRRSTRSNLLRRMWKAWMDNRSIWKPNCQALGKLRSRLAVELGCADGWFCAELMREGWKVIGVEPVAQAADQARNKGIEVVSGSAFDLQVDPGTVGFVAAWMVIEHLPNPVATVSRVAQWLESGGYFAFSVPNSASLEAMISGSCWSGYDGGRHLQFFSPASVRRLLQLAGLEIQQIQFQNTLQPWLGAWGSWHYRRSPNSRKVQSIRSIYMDAIPFRWQVVLSPCTNFLASFRLASRMTIIARKTSPPTIGE